MMSYCVLVVTNLWPTEADPGYGSFVEAQMESLRPLGVEFDVLFIDGRASRWNYLRAIGELRHKLREKRSTSSTLTSVCPAGWLAASCVSPW